MLPRDQLPPPSGYPTGASCTLTGIRRPSSSPTSSVRPSHHERACCCCAVVRQSLPRGQCCAGAFGLVVGEALPVAKSSQPFISDSAAAKALLLRLVLVALRQNLPGSWEKVRS